MRSNLGLRRTLLSMIPLALLAQALPASAALGGSLGASGNELFRRKAAVVGTEQQSAYTMQSVLTESGTEVHQYAAQDGTIFLVTWNGLRMPDLKSLFGGYYDQYQVHLAQRRAAGMRGPVVLRSEALVVESAGRMGAFTGRAYVPSLVPAGLDLGALQ